MHYAEILKGYTNNIFRCKILIIFLFYLKTDRGYTLETPNLESPQWGGSNE